jgi:chromosome segregation ATPase
MITAAEPPAIAHQVGGNHYKDAHIQPWDVVATWPKAQQVGVMRHGELKYLMRAGSKDAPMQEHGKGGHYNKALIEVLANMSQLEIDLAYDVNLAERHQKLLDRIQWLESELDQARNECAGNESTIDELTHERDVLQTSLVEEGEARHAAEESRDDLANIADETREQLLRCQEIITEGQANLENMHQQMAEMAEEWNRIELREGVAVEVITGLLQLLPQDNPEHSPESQPVADARKWLQGAK